MLVYRISLAKYSDKLIASGNAARWSSTDVKMIYTASSRSLACLENIVHRTQAGLLLPFNVMIIEIPDRIRIKTIALDDLPSNWTMFDEISFTREIGDKWILERQTAVLQVPSSIIDEEVNYLINPNHPDFSLIRLIKTRPFIFDERIKT